MKRTSYVIAALTLLACMQAPDVAAQRTVSIQCSINNFADGWTASCSSDAECSRLYADHLCSAHGQCGGGSSTPTPHPSKAPLLGLFTGAVLGAALGGAADVGKTEEEKEIDKQQGKAPGAVVGAGVGAAVGLSMGFMIKAISKYGSPEVGSWLDAHLIRDVYVPGAPARIGLRW